MLEHVHNYPSTNPEANPCMIKMVVTLSISCSSLKVQASQHRQEVSLLHDLAKQLPDDELLYGKDNWCHTSSRLARAELAQDNVTSIHLRNWDFGTKGAIFI